jgi:hypothetical protein
MTCQQVIGAGLVVWRRVAEEAAVIIGPEEVAGITRLSDQGERQHPTGNLCPPTPTRMLKGRSRRPHTGRVQG